MSHSRTIRSLMQILLNREEQNDSSDYENDSDQSVYCLRVPGDCLEESNLSILKHQPDNNERNNSTQAIQHEVRYYRDGSQRGEE